MQSLQLQRRVTNEHINRMQAVCLAKHLSCIHSNVVRTTVSDRSINHGSRDVLLSVMIAKWRPTASRLNETAVPVGNVQYVIDRISPVGL